jgi:HAE1 family hydrophobic/amphiphilic exporter-1
MTALAFIFGCLPLWTASGSGAVGRRILGTVVIGGMLASTIIAIFIVPVTFAVVERWSHRFRTMRVRKETREPVHHGDAL